jgi:DNA gyrase inhibitor
MPNTDYNNVFLREEYISRINKVQDYIEANIGEELSLSILSNVANFSQYHFHRIFCAIVGEPLSKYIQRTRLEKAALSITANPKDTIAQIALKCGFPNQASFSRAFRKHFGFSASQLRADSSLLKSKKCKMESKPGKDDLNSFTYNDGVRDIQSWVQPAADISLGVDVKDIRETPVVYIRNTGMFKGEPELFKKLLDKLFRWAGVRGLIQFPETKILALYHDNPDVTDEDRFRSSICMTVPGDIEVDGEIGKMTIPGGKYAVGHFVLGADDYKRAWDFMFGIWLPKSGYQSDARPCFEVYLNNPEDHLDKKCIVDMYVPVKLL